MMTAARTRRHIRQARSHTSPLTHSLTHSLPHSLTHSPSSLRDLSQFWQSLCPSNTSHIHLLTHTFTYSLTHSLTHSHIRLLTSSLPHSHIRLLTSSLPHSHIRLLTSSLPHSHIHLLTPSLTPSLTLIPARPQPVLALALPQQHLEAAPAPRPADRHDSGGVHVAVLLQCE
jgi:hypothetical protein